MNYLCSSAFVFPILGIKKLFRFQIRSRAEKNMLNILLMSKLLPLCLYQGKDEQWTRAMEYVSLVSELNYMTQVCKHMEPWDQGLNLL
jgi:hypothetical protein